VADDEKFFLVLVEIVLNVDQQPDVLLDGEPADETEGADRIFRIACSLGGMEKFGIDAARHQETGAAGRALEERAQLGVGGEEDPCLAVEPGRNRQRQLFNHLAGRRGVAPGQQAQKPVGAARRVLVYVRMPACGQRDMHAARQERAEDSHFAGAGNVNQVGSEPLQHVADEREVAQKHGIEAQILFKREGKKTARQLEGPNIAVFH
jgi:hypothetical protein